MDQGGLSYTDEGNGVPVLCLHGAPGSVRDFRWIAGLLGENHRVIRTEQPGFGATPIEACPDSDFRSRADWFARCMDSLKLDRAFLFCHSLGGGYGAALAAHHPDRVLGLAMVCALGLRRHRGMRSAPMAQYVSPLLRIAPLRRAMVPILRQGFIRAGFPKSTSAEALVQTMHMVASINFQAHRQHLEMLTAPCFVAWAEDDSLVETDISLGLAEVSKPGPRHPFPSGGHNLQKTQAVSLAHVFAQWSASVEGAEFSAPAKNGS